MSPKREFRRRAFRLPKEIRISIQFYPKENYRRAGLSWPDNYWVKRAAVPFGLRTYDPSSGSLASVRAEGRAGSLENYFTGDGGPRTFPRTLRPAGR